MTPSTGPSPFITHTAFSVAMFPQQPQTARSNTTTVGRGQAGRWGTCGSQAAKHSPGPRNTSLPGQHEQKHQRQITTSLFQGSRAAESSGFGLQPEGERREKERFREPSQARLGNGSPGKGPVLLAAYSTASRAPWGRPRVPSRGDACQGWKMQWGHRGCC